MLNIDSSMPDLWRYGGFNYSALKSGLIKLYLKHSLPEISFQVTISVFLKQTNRKKSRVYYRKFLCFL